MIPISRQIKNVNLESSLICFFFFLSMERSGVDGELSALLERLLPPGWVFCGVHLSHCALLN